MRMLTSVPASHVHAAPIDPSCVDVGRSATLENASICRAGETMLEALPVADHTTIKLVLLF